MMSSDDSGHTQLKCKCVSCGLHFIILTEEPETHKAEGIVCPECGVKGYKFVWIEKIDAPIFRVVPGSAELSDIAM